MFTELIRELGVKGLQVEELYGLEEGFVEELQPVFGLIFLFKWDTALESRRKREVLEDGAAVVPPEVFFARQTVHNACATQAILSIILNIASSAPGIEVGPDLVRFRAFAEGLDAEMRGEEIGANELIRRVHNSFARPELMYTDPASRRSASASDEDPFHFVSLLPVGGTLYEFDGLKAGPVSHGRCSEQWIGSALEVVQRKISDIQESGAGEIRFNLMAVIKDRSLLYRERIDQQIRSICQLEDSLRLHPAADPNDPSDPRQQQISNLLAQNADLEARLEEEQLKTLQHQRENARRRHNFVPLALSLLTELAKTVK